MRVVLVFCMILCCLLRETDVTVAVLGRSSYNKEHDYVLLVSVQSESITVIDTARCCAQAPSSL